MYTLSWKGCGETIRILFNTEDSAKIWAAPKNTIIAAHRNYYFVSAISIMYTLSWKGCGETIRILFDGEDSAEIWDEFFVFGKAE